MNNKTLSSHLDLEGKASTENVYLNITPSAYDDQYCFEFSRRGIAVIIINDKFQGQNRYGCDKDLQFLQELFSKFGFEIRTFYDKTGQELLTELKHISTEDHSSYDCFVLAISTHGEEAQHDNTREDVIFTSDVRVKTRLILELFDDENCPTLKDKPRLVFIQACRGSKLDDGVDVQCTIEPSSELSEDVPDKQLGFLSVSSSHISQPSDSLDALPYGPTKYLQPEIKTSVMQFGLKQSTHHQQPSPQISNKLSNTVTESRWKAASEQTEVCIKPVPCFKDCLVMYATPPGFFAFRRTTDGSWFIKCLAEVLLKSDGSRTLLQELTKVISKVSQDFQSKNRNEKLDAKKQSPVIYSMLTKDVYLKPKF